MNAEETAGGASLLFDELQIVIRYLLRVKANVVYSLSLVSTIQ